jgi:NRPS condensation-like uncharacterized protein
MYSKYYYDYLNKLYEEANLTTKSYYFDTLKAMGNYFNLINLSFGYQAGSPNTLPVNGHDLYNYFARYRLGNFQIEMVLELNGKLDFRKLSKAVRLSVDAEPVFGCRFIEADPPFWRRLDYIDETMLCSMENTENPDEAVKRFLESHLDMDNDPMVKAKLIRSDEKDTLCIKVNHACCDATGTKEYVQLLSDIYSRLDDEKGVYVPQPTVRTRRDQDRLFEALGIKDPEASFIPGSDALVPTWKFPWKYDREHFTRVEVCKLPDGQLDIISNYAVTKGATVNDLILTAFYRAMHKMDTPIYDVPMEIPVTVDLRRYLPDHKTEAIRNFSGSVTTRLFMIENEPFPETLSRVMAVMNEIKKDNPGLQSAIGLELVEKMSYKDLCTYFQAIPHYSDVLIKYIKFYGDRCLPVLSNVGYISRSLIKFGQVDVTGAYMIPPNVAAPALLLMPSSYNGVMTLAVSYYGSLVERSDIQRLLKFIRDELIEGCNNDI